MGNGSVSDCDGCGYGHGGCDYGHGGSGYGGSGYGGCGYGHGGSGYGGCGYDFLLLYVKRNHFIYCIKQLLGIRVFHPFHELSFIIF